jgi:hypothetical protein
MTIANPDYNPGWEIIHDYHQEHRTHLELKIKAFHQTMRDDYALLEQLDKELTFHHQTCLHCLDTLQHKTTADYVAWLRQNGYQDYDERFTIDLASLRTMQDVKNAFIRYKN